MPRRPRLVLPVLAAALLAAAPAAARAQGSPEVWTLRPEHAGERANAPLPLERGQRNAGGSDGLGLCVVASICNSLRYAGEDDAADWLWATARRRPGGYAPSKLERLLVEARERFPRLEWVQYVSPDPEFAFRWSATGRPIASTYGTGRAYGMRPIAHMVSLLHATPRWACVLDNNPIYRVEGGSGLAYAWMPWPEFWRRHRMMSGPWSVVLTTPLRPRPWTPRPPEGESGASLALWLVVVDAALVAGFAALRRRRHHEHEQD